jgi:uncharacterized protein YchJ
MQLTTELTPNQLTFLDWVTRGYSIEDAAKEIDHRWAAIIDWKRNIPEFHLALEEALDCRAMLIRERAHGLIYEALDVLQRIVQDPKASPSLRLRASLALIKMSSKPAGVTKRRPTPSQETSEKSENVHNSAQPQPIRRPVEPGRNSVCRCGSGLKFKRCCGNPVPATATGEATAA